MKKIIIGIVVVIVLAFLGVVILAFVSPTEFSVERDIEIAKPKAEVFAYLKPLKNQNEWGPWTKRDPNVKLTYEGTDGEVGFISKWDSDHEELGTGEQEIKKIVEGERIDYELRFIKPWEATNNAWMITEESGAEKTKVRWGFSGEMPRPMNLMLVFTDFEALIGKDFEDGLKNLKEVVEKRESPKEKDADGDSVEDPKGKDDDSEGRKDNANDDDPDIDGGAV